MKRGQNTTRGGRTPSRRKIAARSLRASGVTSRLFLLKAADRVLAAQEKGKTEFVRQHV